jgi:indoleamine 2,3-dioxygenase
MATLHTIAGGIDESWFYRITMGIETAGAPALPPIMRFLRRLVESDIDVEASVKDLRVIKDCIDAMSVTLNRMYDHCDPYVFYHRVRIYFSGWSNMASLPNGLVYEGDQGEIEAMFAAEITANDPLFPAQSLVDGDSSVRLLIHYCIYLLFCMI